MTERVSHPTLGEILYEENFWTGKKNLYQNGKPLERIDKKTFAILCGDESKYVYVNGNVFMGISLFVDGEIIQVTPKTTWYELACSIFIFVFLAVWSNNITLCTIVPIIGGAIGGGIYGVMVMLNIILMKKTDNILFKLLIWLGMLVGSFAIGFVLAMLILL